MMSLLQAAQWLEETSLSTGIRESTLVFPLLEGSHLLLLAFSVGTIIWVDLRLLGITMRRVRVTDVVEQLQPYTLSAFALAFVSGFLLLVSEPVKCYSSWSFRIKLIALAFAGLNALIFHSTVYQKVDQWDQEQVTPMRARLAGALGILLWFTVIAAGRWQAYQ